VSADLFQVLIVSNHFDTRENALNCILGVPDAVYHDVDSIAIGEEKVRIAINEGHIEMVEPWVSPDL
jgi:hypothetical protein